MSEPVVRPWQNAGIGTDLYQRTIAFEYGDAPRAMIMRKVWTPTPWMVDARTGSPDDGIERDMMLWCREQFGDESSPIHDRPGVWHRGSATVHGWTWWGFAELPQLIAFIEELKRRAALKEAETGAGIKTEADRG